MVQAVKTIIDSNKLETLIPLPASFQNRKVEVTIQVVTDEVNKTYIDKNSLPESESFGMWKDRTDMDDVGKYVRDMRTRRKF
ncbi:MAG: hypothetical protein LBT68_02755 [Spirochaetales bacterium]|jgi:hypothetical protein|nr:hypothetical protein [Spirochaetales bacterium]